MEKKMNIREKLMMVQSELKAPKGQYNSFGKYKYRSCEDILEGVKPLLLKYQLVLTIKDDIEMIGDRYYIKATATLSDISSDDTIEVYARAREEENKKGMDASQVTGATSSYCRKYCLNGLFCIDDTKDADTDEHKNQTNKTDKKPEKKKTYREQVIDMAKEKGIDVKELATDYGLNGKTTEDRYKEVLEDLRGLK